MNRLRLTRNFAAASNGTQSKAASSRGCEKNASTSNFAPSYTIHSNRYRAPSESDGPRAGNRNALRHRRRRLVRSGRHSRFQSKNDREIGFGEKGTAAGSDLLSKGLRARRARGPSDVRKGSLSGVVLRATQLADRLRLDNSLNRAPPACRYNELSPH